MRRPAQFLWPLMLLSCSAPSGTDAAPAELASITVSPASVTIGVGDSAVFSVTGHLNDGSTSSVTATWSATGGTIANGTFHAGNAAGTYRVIASTSTNAGDFADTAQVTVDSVPVPVTLSSVTVAPQLDTMVPGGTRTFVATGHYSNGSASAVTATWTATGGTINGSGLYTAGSTLGNFRVIGTVSGKADTSTVVIKAIAPTLTSVTVAPALDTLVPGGQRTFAATGHYSDGSSGAVAATWSATGGSISTGGLYTAGTTLGTFRVIGTVSGKADTSTVVIKAGVTPTGDTLLVENFDDSNAGARGWYANTSPTISTTNKHSGAGALEMKWNTGTDIPVNGVSLRHLFTSSDRIYLRYWVKYSTNFVGSGLAYHPHEIQFLTDKDDMWIGPSATHLTTYVEHNWNANGGVPRLAATDVLNIDQTKLFQDLTNVTENRAVAGCNGNSDGYPTGCYAFGNINYNEKVWLGPSAVFSNNSGSPAYKNNWHKVEVVYQMNSIVGGKGQNDGVAQYWFDGQLQIDLHNVLLRTGANATMKFNQILLAFYIGDLSPATQTVWIDDLIVATGPVP